MSIILSIFKYLKPQLFQNLGIKLFIVTVQCHFSCCRYYLIMLYDLFSLEAIKSRSSHDAE